ncbi:hypothetical protein [Methanothermobacter sp.]
MAIPRREGTTALKTCNIGERGTQRLPVVTVITAPVRARLRCHAMYPLNG